jgi:hypothetical protein
MEAGRNKKGNAEELVRDDTLWQDPMSYPAYNSESLIERAATGRKETENNSIDTAAGKVAA